MKTTHVTGIYRASHVFFAAILLLSPWVGRAGAGEAGAPAKRVIWADKPVIILPNQPKPMRVRGGYELDIEWKNGELLKAVIRGVSNEPQEFEVRYRKGTRKIAVQRGETRVLQTRDFGDWQ